MIKKHEKEINNNTLRLNDLKAEIQRLKLVINFDESQLQKKSHRHEKKHTALEQNLEKNRTEREKLERNNRYVRTQVQEEQIDEYYAHRPE